MGNVPPKNFVVCCLTVSCRTRCPCSLAHSFIFAMFVMFMGTIEIGFKFCISRKVHCELWNGIIGFPVVEVFDRPVCYPLNRFSHWLSKSRQFSGKPGAGLFFFMIAWRFSTTKVNKDCSLIAFVASGLINSEAFGRWIMNLITKAHKIAWSC